MRKSKSTPQAHFKHLKTICTPPNFGKNTKSNSSIQYIYVYNACITYKGKYFIHNNKYKNQLPPELPQNGYNTCLELLLFFKILRFF